MEIKKRYVMHFPPNLIDKPIISDAVRKYNFQFNILKAYITPEEEGTLVIELIGEEKNLENIEKDLKEMGVKVQTIESDIKMLKETCTDCGVCVPLCPTGALKREDDFTISFLPSKCVACEICIKACPTKAMISTI